MTFLIICHENSFDPHITHIMSNPFPADLATFTEKFRNGNFYTLWSAILYFFYKTSPKLLRVCFLGLLLFWFDLGCFALTRSANLLVSANNNDHYYIQPAQLTEK